MIQPFRFINYFCFTATLLLSLNDQTQAFEYKDILFEKGFAYTNQKTCISESRGADYTLIDSSWVLSGLSKDESPWIFLESSGHYYYPPEGVLAGNKGHQKHTQINSLIDCQVPIGKRLYLYHLKTPYTLENPMQRWRSMDSFLEYLKGYARFYLMTSSQHKSSVGAFPNVHRFYEAYEDSLRNSTQPLDQIREMLEEMSKSNQDEQQVKVEGGGIFVHPNGEDFQLVGILQFGENREAQPVYLFDKNTLIDNILTAYACDGQAGVDRVIAGLDQPKDLSLAENNGAGPNYTIIDSSWVVAATQDLKELKVFNKNYELDLEFSIEPGLVLYHIKTPIVSRDVQPVKRLYYGRNIQDFGLNQLANKGTLTLAAESEYTVKELIPLSVEGTFYELNSAINNNDRFKTIGSALYFREGKEYYWMGQRVSNNDTSLYYSSNQKINNVITAYACSGEEGARRVLN